MGEAPMAQLCSSSTFLATAAVFLGCWSSLQQALGCCFVFFAAVTEEELSQALLDGEEITAPPARRSVGNGCPESAEPSAAESTTETESELLNFGLEETK